MHCWNIFQNFISIQINTRKQMYTSMQLPHKHFHVSLCECPYASEMLHLFLNFDHRYHKWTVNLHGIHGHGHTSPLRNWLSANRNIKDYSHMLSHVLYYISLFILLLKAKLIIQLNKLRRLERIICACFFLVYKHKELEWKFS